MSDEIEAFGPLDNTVDSPLHSVTTVVILVHGVGDHSGHDILEAAQRVTIQKPEWHCQVVQIQSLASPEQESASSDALKIREGDKTHILIPAIWSRLRLRVAKERDFASLESVSARFQRFTFDAFFKLLLTVWNFLRCVPATVGIARRTLIIITALLYSVLFLGLTGGAFALGVYLIVRVNANQSGVVWWRYPALILAISALTWVVKKLLIVSDFVGDVAAYVGSRQHRQTAASRFHEFLGQIAVRAPTAQIVVVSHSLGTVLVTNAIAEMPALTTLESRLHVVTMGCPLPLMHWFFPTRVLGHKQLLDQFEKRNLAKVWLNLWRDADWIGRAVGAAGTARFAEKSLGDGSHANYWADSRCWSIIISYLQAVAQGSLDTFAASWVSGDMSEGEERELVRRAQLAATYAITINILIIVGPFYAWRWIRAHDWLSAVPPWDRWLILSMTGITTVLVAVYYFFASARVGGQGVTRRQMLARYRLY